MADETKSVEALELELSKAKDEITKRDEKISALESQNHDLKIKNEALHELSLHQATKSGNKRLMEDFE